MNASLLDGKVVANHILAELKQFVLDLKPGEKPPGLAVILLGNHDASKLYVQGKRRISAEIGFNSVAYDLPSSLTEEELISLINRLNETHEVNGILVQLPLPAHINNQVILETIHPTKDVDGFHPYNVGRLVQKKPILRSCTPAGIMNLFHYYQLPLSGKHAVILGASNIVGRPMALELLMAGCTVTVCHSASIDINHHVSDADILVTAMGVRGIVDSSRIKEGAIVVDVAMNRDENGKLCGDLDFNQAAQRAAWITPVPGGVGPMTIATLMQNTLRCYQLQQEILPQ
ncbi:MAG: bifunctional methylenetetrahydrofolate dehydrogenase/methenyltetrahydrofolate cyclohydrolase FolD [Legionellales bacterium]|nr:bifunctional methylenetetrahydrofolate dehydrogenase/methenyltetrahydrofolate cyclohydrolase FolD [Legionellales bacterium]